MKKALATIDTAIGPMTIYFNGANEEITAEANGIVEEAGYIPENEDDAVDAIAIMWGGYEWNLAWIEA